MWERLELPVSGQGLTVGLLGGSFDPPHAGHAHVARRALVRFGLNRVILLVSPGNPLKARPPAPISDRVAAARALVAHPRISVSDFEARAGTRYTAETLALLRKAHPGTRFVWLMGADNLAQLHRWEAWRDIAESVPMGILARPGQRLAALTSPAARLYRGARLPQAASHRLAEGPAPRWCFVNLPMVNLSSTALRAHAASTRDRPCAGG